MVPAPPYPPRPVPAQPQGATRCQLGHPPGGRPAIRLRRPWLEGDDRGSDGLRPKNRCGRLLTAQRMRSPRRRVLHQPRARLAVLIARRRRRSIGEGTSVAPADRLSSWGAFISAMATAAGLVVSGVATWTAVEALNDQCEQSASQAREQTRRRAGRVSIWTENVYDASSTLHLMNRLPDPVARWGLLASAPEFSRGWNEFKRGPLPPPPVHVRHRRLIQVQALLPPCSHIVLDLPPVVKKLESSVEGASIKGGQRVW